MPFLLAYQYQFASFSPFCKWFENKSKVMKEEMKQHGAADKCLSKQQLYKSYILL